MTDIWKPRFADLWKSGSFRKLGRVEAQKRFLAQIKTEEGWRDIQAAAVAYNAHCRREAKWYRPMNGSTFFGTRKGWRDWIPDETETATDDHEEAPPLIRRIFIAEEEDMERAIQEIRRRDREETLRRWRLDAEKHQHGPACQHGKVCKYVESKRPKV